MVLASNHIQRLPIDALAHILAYAVQTPHDLQRIGAVARVLREGRGGACFRIHIDDWRVNMEIWTPIAQALARMAPKCISLHFQGCNLDHNAVDTFISALHNLSEISLSKCFGVQGELFMGRLSLSALAQPRLRVAILSDLPSVHSTLVFPVLPNLICLGLTNCNLEVVNPPNMPSNGRAPFLELLAGALSSGCLPKLKHLFLGGAVLEPDNTSVEADEGIGIVTSEIVAASQPGAISANETAITTSDCTVLDDRCPKLTTLEVTFLAPLVVARVRRLLAKAINPSTAVLCLITTPLQDLKLAFELIVKEFPCASRGVTEARNEQKASALHAWCLPSSSDVGQSSENTVTTSNRNSKTISDSDSDQRVLWLLTMGARPSLKDDRGATPLFRASERGASATVIEALLQAGAHAVHEVNHKREGPLFISALKGQAHVVRTLLEFLKTKQVAVSSPSPGVTAAPAEASRTTAATTPAVSEASPAEPTPTSLNPLAAEWQPSTAASIPPKKAASISANKSSVAVGGTAERDARSLLTVQTSDTERFSPLHCAVLRRCEATLTALLESKCFDVEARTKHGQTALHLAVRSAVLLGRSSPHSCASVTAAERERAADMSTGGRSTGDGAGTIPRESLRLVELLFTYGADANARDDSGSVPLDYCAPNSDGKSGVISDVEALLLKWGAGRKEPVNGGRSSTSKQPHKSKQSSYKGKNHRRGKKKGPP